MVTNVTQEDVINYGGTWDLITDIWEACLRIPNIFQMTQISEMIAKLMVMKGSSTWFDWNHGRGCASYRRG